MLLISVSMTTISSIGPGFEGVLFMEEPKDFFMAEMIFTVGGDWLAHHAGNCRYRYCR